MNNLEIDNKKLDLLKRSNMLLEKTKKNHKMFQEERKLLLKLTSDKSLDYEIWENILTSIEILIEGGENDERKNCE